jgi:uracil-DNA glycosylase family 4
MNRGLALAVRNPDCTKCKLHADAEQVCVVASGKRSRIMVVTKTALASASKMRAELVAYFAEVGLDAETFMWASAVKCNTWSVEPSKGDLKACAPYLRDEFRVVDPDYVITFGAEAWFSASGHADITKNRGRLFDVSEGSGQIFPTISPAAVARSPGLRTGFIADLHYFARLVRGESTDGIPFHTNAGHVTTVGTKAALRDALTAIRGAVVSAYDIETNGGSEFDSDARMVSIAVTTAGADGMASAHTWEIPLWHPDSPFESRWLTVVRMVVEALLECPRLVAHNAKFDTKWGRRFGQSPRAKRLLTPTFDTIIAAAVLDENRPKALKGLAQSILGADPWGIDVHSSDWYLRISLADILTYNGLDTWHDLRLYYVFKEQLQADKRLAALFTHLMMPLVQELIAVEQRGVYVDRDTLVTNWNTVRGKLEVLERELMTFVPADHPFRVFVKRTGELKSEGINWNPSNFLRWLLFDHLALPVIKRGKRKDDGSPGDPSVDTDTLSALAEMGYSIAGLLYQRSEWNKYDTAFFSPWSEQLDDNSRIHSVFKPWGTVTGRMSSGKEDAEKVAATKQNRGVNMQQVPRNKLARGVFGAAPGHVFVEFDYSQVELRVAAWLADERRMLHLYQTGQDIHMAMAVRMTGKPAAHVTAEERKRAKAVNFGFLYGMGWAKFISTAWSNYGVHVTEEEARAFRKTFFDEFPGLMPWHNKQRRLAYKYGRVQTPMGRVRNLPDIRSEDDGVRSEAERQAINSPVQGFASDMASLSLVHTSRAFRKLGLRAYPIAAVHDAVNFEIHRDDAPAALPIIKQVMENLPLQRMFGIDLTVPIIADCKVGTHWGGATPLDDVTMLQRPDDLAAWIEKVVS